MDAVYDCWFVLYAKNVGALFFLSIWIASAVRFLMWRWHWQTNSQLLYKIENTCKNIEMLKITESNTDFFTIYAWSRQYGKMIFWFRSMFVILDDEGNVLLFPVAQNLPCHTVYGYRTTLYTSKQHLGNKSKSVEKFAQIRLMVCKQKASWTREKYGKLSETKRADDSRKRVFQDIRLCTNIWWLFWLFSCLPTGELLLPIR